MARGFLSGVIWGTVVAGIGTGVLSIATGHSEAPRPQAAALEVPAGSEFNQSREDTQAALPGSEPVQTEAIAPQVVAPVPDSLASLRGAATDSAAMPQAGQPQAVLTAPGTSAGEVAVQVGGEAPVQTGAQSGAPRAPQGEAELSISTDPAQPRPPEAEAPQSAFAAAPEAGGAGPDVQSNPPVEPAAPLAFEAAGDSVSDVSSDPEPVVITPKVVATPAPDNGTQELVIVVEPAVKSVPEPQAVATADVTAEPETDSPTEVEAEASPAPAPVVVLKPEPQAEEQIATIRIGKPSSGLKNLATGVATNRLPSVGGTQQAAAATDQAGDPAVGPSGEPVADAAGLPPVERFAVPFEDPENKPKMAIVLIDEGTGPIGLEALTTFPYPLSFAVDTGWDGAEAAMAKYRAAGFEVLALVGLPEGARAADVEVAMPVLMAKVPEAVGVMEAPGDGLQSNREISDQVAGILAASGHGLLLFSKGLNTAQKLAAKAGVRSATVFRDFDDKGQNASAIRRFLNHAALKAGSEGGVVMVGRLRADTVTALLLWGLQERSDQVALVPITQLLKAQ